MPCASGNSLASLDLVEAVLRPADQRIRAPQANNGGASSTAGDFVDAGAFYPKTDPRDIPPPVRSSAQRHAPPVG